MCRFAFGEPQKVGRVRATQGFAAPTAVVRSEVLGGPGRERRRGAAPPARADADPSMRRAPGRSAQATIFWVQVTGEQVAPHTRQALSRRDISDRKRVRCYVMPRFASPYRPAPYRTQMTTNLTDLDNKRPRLNGGDTYCCRYAYSFACACTCACAYACACAVVPIRSSI